VRIFSSKEEEQQHSRQKQQQHSLPPVPECAKKNQPKNYDYKRNLEKDLFQLSIDFLLLQLLWVAW
jgi:hypothetical protein